MGVGGSMIGNKYTGDNIALEFAKLMKKATHSEEDVVAIDNVTDNESEAADGMGVNAADFLVKNQEKSPDTSATQRVENSIKDLNSSAGASLGRPVKRNVKNTNTNNGKVTSYASEKDRFIMNGLGKIAGSLRRKGDAFAADLVETTAISVSKDLRDAYAKKASVVSELNKIAKELDAEGGEFASDLVKVTINKILKD